MQANLKMENDSPLKLEKSNFCDCCQKKHGKSVTLINMIPYTSEDVYLCQRKFAKYLSSHKYYNFQSTLSGATSYIKKLVKLKAEIGELNSREARIDFLATVFAGGLQQQLISYDLFDEFTIGERDYDTCFEMRDGEEVITGLIKKCHGDYWLRVMLKKQIGEDGFLEWVSIYERITGMQENL